MSSRQINAAPPAALFNATTAANQIFTKYNNALVAAILGIPGEGRLANKRFIVRASGYATTNGAAITVQPVIYVGTSLTAASDNPVLAAPAAVTQNTTTAPWYLEASLIYDNIVGRLIGTFSSLINGTYGASAAIPANLSIPFSNQIDPILQLVCGVTFSAAGAGNLANLTEFVVED